LCAETKRALCTNMPPDPQAGWRVELAALLTFRAREFAEKIFVDATKCVVVERGRNFRDAFKQLLDQRAGKQLVAFRKYAGKLRVVALNRAHRIVQLRSDICAFRELEEKIKTRIRREEKNSVRMISRRIIKTRTAPTSACLFFERCPLLRESNFSKSQEDQPENRSGILLSGESRVCAKLISGFPKSLLERVIRCVFF